MVWSDYNPQLLLQVSSEEESREAAVVHRVGFRRRVFIAIACVGVACVVAVRASREISHLAPRPRTSRPTKDAEGNHQLAQLFLSPSTTAAAAVSQDLHVRMASVNFQTPEFPFYETREKIMKAHLNSFFAGVDIFAMQETKQNGAGGYKHGGDLTVKRIQKEVLGGGTWKYIVPTEAFDDVSADDAKTDCDVSIFYDSSKWELEKSGSRITAEDAFDKRSVVWGVFRRPLSLEYLAVFNTHGPIGNIFHGYNSQIDVIGKAVQQVRDKYLGVHVIIVGDFNRASEPSWFAGHGVALVEGDNSHGGNFDFDWVFSSPYETGHVTYGSLKKESGVCHGDECSTETGSDHKAVLVDMTYSPSARAAVTTTSAAVRKPVPVVIATTRSTTSSTRTTTRSTTSSTRTTTRSTTSSTRTTTRSTSTSTTRTTTLSTTRSTTSTTRTTTRRTTISTTTSSTTIATTMHSFILATTTKSTTVTPSMTWPGVITIGGQTFDITTAAVAAPNFFTTTTSTVLGSITWPAVTVPPIFTPITTTAAGSMTWPGVINFGGQVLQIGTSATTTNALGWLPSR